MVSHFALGRMDNMLIVIYLQCYDRKFLVLVRDHLLKLHEKKRKVVYFVAKLRRTESHIHGDKSSWNVLVHAQGHEGKADI
jgi:hypothetical protein